MNRWNDLNCSSPIRFLAGIAVVVLWIYNNNRISFSPEVLMQVAKWGNSLAVRLPTPVVEALDLKEGDSIEIDVVGARRFEIKKAPGARQLLARLRKYRGRLPVDFKFDRIEANARR